jgi:uncharacterized membrane protein YdjX (TVP38/TMEM64 family)
MSKKKLLLLIFFIGAFIFIRFTDLTFYFSFEYLQAQKLYFQSLVQNNPLLAPFIFILMYFLGVTFSIPGAAVLTVAGGFLFGLLPAVLYVNIAATAGAVGIFLLVRYVWENKKNAKAAGMLKRFNQEIQDHGHWYLLVFRLIPIFPFFLINIFAARTKISLKTYTWATALGIIPGTFLYASAGMQLSKINQISDILTWQSFIILIGLAVFAISPVLWRRIRK